jgi:MYXO-CTERM domain-containing protein
VWQANNCDPCPETPLQLEELVTLGADVLPKYAGRVKSADGSASWQVPGEFVLTRLHARYGKEALGEDLVFKSAGAIVGGREIGGAGKLEQGAQPGGSNTFQGRYIIRHPWTGPITCKEPIRGRWGGPWPDWKGGGGAKPQAAQNLAFAPRGANLGMYVAQDMPELQVVAVADDVPEPAPTKSETKVEAKVEAKSETKVEAKSEPATKSSAGCGCAAGETDAAGGLAGLLGLAWLGRRRRRN